MEEIVVRMLMFSIGVEFGGVPVRSQAPEDMLEDGAELVIRQVLRSGELANVSHGKAVESVLGRRIGGRAKGL
jgi:hypothetical protein